MSLSRRDISRIIAEEEGDPSRIGTALERRDLSSQDLLIHYDLMLRCLGIDSIKARLKRALEEEQPESFLPFIVRLRDIFPDPELREKLMDVFHNRPWAFYTRSPIAAEALFSNDYFRRLIAGGTNFFEDPDLFKIFVFNNATRLLTSVAGEELQEGIMQKMGDRSFPGVEIGEQRGILEKAMIKQ